MNRGGTFDASPDGRPSRRVVFSRDRRRSRARCALERPTACGIADVSPLVRRTRRSGRRRTGVMSVTSATPARRATRMAAEQAFQKGMALLRDDADGGSGHRAAPRLPAATGVARIRAVRQLGGSASRSEVPSEADQPALLEIAQRAKKRDPMFAFGSYVIGQLAMWAGDDAAAKKWFYEALRLDPTSEAGQQVRILARHGTAGPAQPGAEGPPRPEPPAEPAPVAAPALAVANVPPAQVVPASPPSKAPSRAGAGGSCLAWRFSRQRRSGSSPWRDDRRPRRSSHRACPRSPRSPSTRLRPLSKNARTRPRHRHRH